MKVYEFVIKFINVKQIGLEAEKNVYIVAENLINAVKILESEFENDKYVADSISELDGIVFVQKEVDE